MRHPPFGADIVAFPKAHIQQQVFGQGIVGAIDRLSLERKAPPTLAIWRAALEAVEGPEEPRLL